MGFGQIRNAAIAGLIGLPVAVAAGLVVRNLTYAGRAARRVTRAGFAQKQAMIGGTRLNYAEGPDNGSPLLLIHGQVTDWQSWDRVLPELSRRHRVFAIDCPGHGKSAHVPEKYTAKAIAGDVAELLRAVVGAPAIVVGHSSGGLIAAVLAADAPELVRGVVLEDPPLFSSVPPRAEKTFNYVDLSSAAHGFLHSGEPDFTTYYLEHSRIWELFKGAKDKVKQNALGYRRRHPDRPVQLWYMPVAFNGLFRAMQSYDPRFGEAFYTGTFHRDFDHAETLSHIHAPAVLIHTNWRYDDKGILLAAMSAEDAERARSLIKDVEFHKVDSGHGFHLEHPREFLRIVLDFAERLRR